MPKVSVIIPTFSRPQLLPRAVESAFSAGTDVEVIVVDDASKDGTAQVCQSLKHIKYVRLERNQHTAGARNVGVMVSTAPYIALLDDDDWRLPETLDRQIELLEKNPAAGMVYGQLLTANQEGNILDQPPSPSNMPEGDIFWDLIIHNFTSPQSLVIRKKHLQKIGLFDSHLSGIDDWDICIRLAELFSVLAFNQPVAVWRSPTQNSQQGTSDLTKLLVMGAKTLKSKWSNLPRFNNASEDKKREVYRSFAKKIGRWAIDDVYYTKRRSGSLRKLSSILQHFPSTVLDKYTYKVLAKKMLSGK